MIYDRIREDLLTARKAKDTSRVSTLSTLAGNMMSNAVPIGESKVVTDEVAISIIKQHLKGIGETSSLLDCNDQTWVSLQAEAALLQSYLPKKLTEEQLQTVIDQAFELGNKTIGQLMAYLKANYPNAYDGAGASRMVKQKIA